MSSEPNPEQSNEKSQQSPRDSLKNVEKKIFQNTLIQIKKSNHYVQISFVIYLI